MQQSIGFSLDSLDVSVRLFYTESAYLLVPLHKCLKI